jgi:4-carboxymuconolactone decarboxylase
MAAVATDTKNTLSAIATGDSDALEAMLGLRQTMREGSRLDGRTFSLVKIATLIALDAAPASYVWQITNALAEGVEPEELLDVLIAVAPQVGGPRVIAAASEIMLALGLTLPEGA